MPQTPEEREFTRRAIEDILSGGPCRPAVARGGRVCQACGEIGTFSGELEEAAGHVHGGEFVAFADGHAQCQYRPPIGMRHHRSFRFCELCQKRTPTERGHRFGKYWLCRECDDRIGASRHPPQPVLSDFAERRFHEYRRLPAAARPDKQIPYDQDDWIFQERAEFPVLEEWLPPGLSMCPNCATIRGTTPGPLKGGQVGLWTSTCICEGPLCRQCGRNRIRRPISDYYDPQDGDWWHVPYFAAMGGCRECRARAT